MKTSPTTHPKVQNSCMRWMSMSKGRKEQPKYRATNIHRERKEPKYRLQESRLQQRLS